MAISGQPIKKPYFTRALLLLCVKLVT